jgi:hypothetical protein
MVDTVALLVSLAAGVPAGFFLGLLFAPDPTGMLSLVVGLPVGLAIAAGLYRSEMLADA